MKTTREMKNRKVLQLCLQFMHMINEDSPAKVFGVIELNEKDKEINFTAANSHSIALEIATKLVFLFELTLYPYVKNGEIKYSLLGN